MKILINKSMIIIISLLSLLFILFSASLYSNALTSNISDKQLRIHIIANSDDSIDQEVKIKVRNSILNYLKTLDLENKSKKEIVNTIEKNIDSIKSISQKTIQANNLSYSIDVELNKYNSQKKEYKNISFPSGLYDSLIIKIGNAKGHNWWSIIYPSLCFSDLDSNCLESKEFDSLKNNLSEEEFNLIINNKSKKIFKFKLIDFIESFIHSNKT